MPPPPTIARAMRALEAARHEEAAGLFAALAGPSPDGVIARFRRAECLSRMGRHAEAVADAEAAVRESPGTPSAPLWLAWVLAEAGRFDDAAAVPYPGGHGEFTDCVRDGFAGLARLAANVPDGRAAVTKSILAARHAPIGSLALRVAERDRLAGPRRWPDPLSVWAVHVAQSDFDETGDGPPRAAPAIRDADLPSRGEVRTATAWLRTWGAAAYEPRVVAALRAAKKPPEDLDLLEAEMLLAAGRLDDAEALLARVLGEIRSSSKDGGDDGAGADLCITATRAAQLAGRALPPDGFPGFDDARLRAKPDVAWLRMCAALASDRPLDARPFADGLSDPSHDEYVEASLLAWSARGRA